MRRHPRIAVQGRTRVTKRVNESVEDVRGALEDAVSDQLDNLDDDDLLTVWHAYCADYDPDDDVYSMDEFNEMLNGSEPIDIAKMIRYGDFNPSDDYWWFDGYGNIESGNVNEKVELSDLEDWLTDKVDDEIDPDDEYEESDIEDMVAEAIDDLL